MGYSDATQREHRQARIAHWDRVARKLDAWAGWGRWYHSRLAQIYRLQVPPGLKVLEVGCGQGDLLAALKPELGVGVDFSGEMIERARQRHPELRFVQADVADVELDTKFDVIILSDLVDDLWNVQTALEQLAELSAPHTRLIINSYSRLWEPLLAVAERLELAKPTLYQNWLTVKDIANLMNLAGFEVIRHWPEILCPLPIPLVCDFLDRFVAKLWPFNALALTNFVVARPCPQPQPAADPPLVSVIVPARNEAGNIPQIFARVPQMGRGTELVFVEGHSKDETYAVIEQEIAKHPELQCTLLKQTGVGKGDAVRLGFAHASGEILMILDADLTVPPEDLPSFYAALQSNKGEFINGVRFVYPMQEQAMRFLNLIGNKLFSLVFYWLLGQPIKDTLCGTKVLRTADYRRIAANRAYFGEFDPFGDFDLLFGAAKLNLKIIDLPIRYAKRTYGTTNIRRWKHGLLLLRMALIAAMRLKFV